MDLENGSVPVGADPFFISGGKLTRRIGRWGVDPI